MSLNGGWVGYSGDAKIELAAGLMAVAGCAAYAGIRLRRPVRAVRPPASVVVLMFSLWVVALIAFLVGLAVYVKQFLSDYPHIRSGVHNPITPVTLLAAAAIFGIIMTRTGWRYQTRLGSAVVGAMAAPMIFELPFDLIVMARTYPALPPDPAFYRAVFFTPLIMVELTTLWLLTLSPMVRVRRSTFFCFALMIGVFGIWALSGFGYPQSALPITMNVVSKILAFITALTLFLPDRLRDWRTDGPPVTPGREQAPQPVMAATAPTREQAPQPVMAAPAPAVRDVTAPKRRVTEGSTVTRATDPAREAIMNGPAIKILGLRKSFGDKQAVAGIDLEIAAGSFAGLVGPNGAGKTTSLSMMTGLLRPDAGQILINGLDVWADPPAAKAIIGVVPAEARLFDRLSGEELLEYAGRLRGLPVAEARARAAQLLDVLDLTADAKRLVADYSSGMRKKAALGCALIHNPSVLFLDEPLEGVDPISADSIRRMLTNYVGSGSTVLFSSHVMELVEEVCDHVSIISQGRIVATGTTEQVRGGKTLQRAFIDLVGSKASEEGLSWLGSSSS
ncbi:MAG TPA: ABC transporter ATP-binding protein [Streptosporangiaceae bacterium]|nr:ABC transporter ATP-binding protein [Streptosporangiaceae bacterium]